MTNIVFFMKGKVGCGTCVKHQPLIPELVLVLALVQALVLVLMQALVLALAQALESGWCVKRQTWNVG